MRAEALDEPELEFGGASRHIDPRFGICSYGPADLAVPGAPRAIRVGLVGPSASLDGLRNWLERCRDPIPAKDERYPHLFPAFPGFDTDRSLHSTLVFSDRNTRGLSSQVLRRMVGPDKAEALELAVAAYADEVSALAEGNRVDVILIARPDELTDTGTTVRRQRRAVRSSSAGTSAAAMPLGPQTANFHDVLKARVLHLGPPIQIIRRGTWDETVATSAGRRRQDEATRAWNLHVAMYYKAGGVPWRLPRATTDLTVCFIGVSFYRNVYGTAIETSVAQVFNERGDGVIVRGGPASINSDDKQPHLSAADAHGLLNEALEAYRREHRTLPARVVLHKSSRFTEPELDGFQRAADGRGVDALELVWIVGSEPAHLFRPGAAPPLRGTLLTLEDHAAALYTKGSVQFYSTYPGMYVPQPIGIRPAMTDRSIREIAAELLALSKMNWNQTQLDGRLPVTLRTANQVKAILRFASFEPATSTTYAHFM
ncbi:hypothetical protein GHK86_09035 [Acidimicrobiaceae bacterium USS-CC1]|uniref:Piwi domain-containing protein n=1 Tax=Acidiferrimicrobium australe TaxID=2664430 RepID=A0ABW9QU45_9ACTN|nr:hypothetical protein [Acidiferrimicrobium australe]